MGSLSKKQLQGLYDKASRIEGLAPNKIATLEAIIKRMPTRYKSEKPEAKPLFEKDVATGKLIDDILAIYPEHKRALFLKAKYVNNEPLSIAELGDLQRFKRIGSQGNLIKTQQKQ